jgi:hypothetical protein
MLEEYNKTVFSSPLNNSSDGALGIELNFAAVETQRSPSTYATALA